jgi:hypothetical protein
MENIFNPINVEINLPPILWGEFLPPLMWREFLL